METKGNKIFRQEAIERLSSPEQLDQMMQVVSPRAWIPLTTVAFLVVVASVWSVVGRIPLTVAGQGVLIQPRRMMQVQASTSGQLSKVYFKPGDFIKRDQILATIDQSALKQQLQQEQARLGELQEQNQGTNKLQKQQIALELKTLRQQQKDLEESLHRESVTPVLHQETLDSLEQKRQSLEESLRREKLAPMLREQTLDALAEKRKSLETRKQQIGILVETLKERVATRRRLFEEKAISNDALLQSQQEYISTLMQVSDIGAQLKELDVQKTNTEQEYLQNLNRIDEIKNTIQEVKVQKTNSKREYLQNLNKIDEINSKIKELQSQEIKIAQDGLEKSNNQSNQIQEVKHKIAQLELKLKGDSKITSPYNGRILEVGIAPGQVVSTGMRLGSLEAEDAKAKTTALVYLADKDGKQIKPGMTVEVTPSVVKRERYGGITGKVTRITPFPVTPQDMSAIIGNESLANSLAETISRNGGGAPVQIFVELQQDPNTTSGYKWSSSNGPPLKISPGTTAQVRVQVAQLAPISYVIPMLRSLTGMY